MLAERQRVVLVSMQARRLTELFGDEALLGHNGIVMVSPEVDLPDPPEPGTLALLTTGLLLPRVRRIIRRASRR